MLAPSTHTVAHVVPLTVAPLCGAVIATFSVPVGGGGSLLVFDTVTVRVAVAVAPAESRAVTPSV